MSLFISSLVDRCTWQHLEWTTSMTSQTLAHIHHPHCPVVPWIFRVFRVVKASWMFRVHVPMRSPSPRKAHHHHLWYRVLCLLHWQNFHSLGVLGSPILHSIMITHREVMGAAMAILPPHQSVQSVMRPQHQVRHRHLLSRWWCQAVWSSRLVRHFQRTQIGQPIWRQSLSHWTCATWVPRQWPSLPRSSSATPRSCMTDIFSRSRHPPILEYSCEHFPQLCVDGQREIMTTTGHVYCYVCMVQAGCNSWMINTALAKIRIQGVFRNPVPSRLNASSLHIEAETKCLPTFWHF